MPLFSGLQLIWGDNCLSISSAVSSRLAVMLAAIQAKLVDVPEKQTGEVGRVGLQLQFRNETELTHEYNKTFMWFGADCIECDSKPKSISRTWPMRP